MGGLVYTAVVLLCATAAAMALAWRSDAGPASTFVSSSHVAAAAWPGSSTRPTAASPAGAGAPVAAPVPSTTIPMPSGGCATALRYLSANAAPGFQFVCPGYADGAQALTCVGQAPCAPAQRMIVIADPCPAAYMNEAHNSWVLLHDTAGTPIPGGDTAIDPFGHC